MFVRPLLALGLTLGLTSTADAALITLGSDLKAEAATSIDDDRRIQQHGADTAFWPLAISNKSAVEAPEDGQIVKVILKGTVFREKGASMPASLIHFQSLGPAAADGSRVVHPVYGTSADFFLPVDKPNIISEYVPENLCIDKGGTWAFNDVGGHTFAGSYEPGVVDNNHYIGGARFGVFGLVDSAETVQYTAADQTKNGFTLFTETENQQIDFPYGNKLKGTELLMQVVIATGDDRTEPCGGPRRHPDGTLVDTGPAKNYLKIVTAGGKPQRPYVTSDRKFQTGVYCGGNEFATCAGTATLMIGKRVLATAPFSFASMKTGRIPMRLKRKDYRKLDKSKTRTLKTTYVLTTSFGVFKSSLTLKR